jgi:S1-C subfamily serine protease
MEEETEQPGTTPVPEAETAAPGTSEVFPPSTAETPVPADPAAPPPPVLAPAMPPPVPPPANPTWPLAPTGETPEVGAEPPTAETPYPYAPAAYGAIAGDGASTPATPSATATPTPPRNRKWVAVAIVAALIGGGAGGAIGAVVAGNNNGNGVGNVTIDEGSATPGAAVLSGNVTIPELVKKVVPAVVSIDVKSDGNEDEGTGMIVTSNGEVITNNHVIELYNQGGGSGSITVTEYGQKKAQPATLIGYNTQDDVALLKITNASGLKTVTFGSSAKTEVGDAVVAIGNALGLAAGTPTVTQGIVSALGRSVTAGGEGTESENLTNLIQTDAAINPGNSGGPLIDTAGQVIGMNTAVAGDSEDGSSAQNIGFAIPIAQVETLIPQLEKGGPPSNSGGYIGVDITTLTSALRQQYGFTPTTGAVILSVVANSPADKAGLQQGDVIVGVDFTNITSAEDLQNAIQKDKAGQKVQVTYYVGDSKRTASVTLGSQAQEQQQATQTPSTDGLGSGGFPGFGAD